MGKERFLVTSALPYANGDLHVGHIAGAYLPGDIFVKYLRLKGEDVLYFCGTDEHGAPISIKAEAEGKTPQEIVDFYHQRMVEDFDGLGIEFDNFSGTARPPHHKLSQEFFLNLLKKGYISTQVSEQYYCPKCERFLADRYVEGVCPHCGKSGARGDQCDACGKLMDSTGLVQPECKICGTTPEVRSTTHWMLDLPAFVPRLKEWLSSKSNWKENIMKFIMGLVDEGLKKRAVTRDIDWGVPVPLEDAEGKVLYVWFDAPIGYVSSSVEYFGKTNNPDGWRDYWLNPQTKLVHFIGKDNNIFHAIFWPAMLMGQDDNYVLPHDIPANEFLNLEGDKLSTSKNWAIWIKDFLAEFDGELLRYYVARIAPEHKDSDFVWKDFQAKVNGELANILGNLANRVFSFGNKFFEGQICKSSELDDKATSVLQEAYALVGEMDENYQNYKVKRNAELGMNLARLGNKYFDETAPWKSVKTDKSQAEQSLYVCCELLRIFSVVYSPILPRACKRLANMLGIESEVTWQHAGSSQDRYVFSGVEPLFPKIEDDKIQAQIDKLKKSCQQEAENADNIPAIKKAISFDKFQEMDLRMGKILECEVVPKSKKLLKLTIDLGTEKRQILSGISKYYTPSQLLGKSVVILANLEARKIMGMDSQGMILAVEGADGNLSLLFADKNISAGSIIS